MSEPPSPAHLPLPQMNPFFLFLSPAAEAATGRAWWWGPHLQPSHALCPRSQCPQPGAAPWTALATSPPAPPSTSPSPAAMLLGPTGLMAEGGHWLRSPHLAMGPTPPAPPSRHPRPPRSGCTSCHTSPPPMSCISSPNTSAALRASRTRRGGTRPACAHDPGA